MKKRKTNVLIFKTLLTTVLTLIILIMIKSNNNFKNNFYKKIYDNNLSFTYFKSIYNKYITSSSILSNFIKTETVFNEKLTYESKEKYLDGVKLKVSKNYLIPVQESGIVVYVGKKEGYNNTIIIQRNDGIDEWYGNINNVNVNMYDYVLKGALLGDVDENLFLVYKKNGKVLNYESYIK